MARIRGGDAAAISSAPDGASADAAWNTYIAVESADETAARVREAAGRVIAGPFDVTEAGRMAVFADPAGAIFCVWQAGRHKGARVVNEPGALVMNGLATPDSEAAKDFYGAVFGWTTMDVGAGEMWTLVGYGDYLEELTPGLRKMTAEFGVPGFEDVVAAINPITGDQSGQSPRWTVTFAVEDADATAAKAKELGGTVLAEPFDAPWARMTVVRDPQGATFIASKFVPENRDVSAVAGSAVQAS
jgi:predicted enzyme related to lactoylglutathione lyase